MTKIDEGTYEIFTTKADAIYKFRRLQGYCRGQVSGENPIFFSCSKKGKIRIMDHPMEHDVDRRNATNLYAQVTEQDGKTYVTYYTAFSNTSHVLKITSIITTVLLAVLGSILTLIKGVFPLPLLFAIPCLLIELRIGSNEKNCVSKDSEALLQELKNRVQAVNLWDK